MPQIDGGNQIKAGTITEDRLRPGFMSPVAVQDENGDIGIFTRLNFVGAGVTASPDGAIADITVPGSLRVRDEGADIGTGPDFQFPILDFVGPGVAATNAGGGVAQITIRGLATTVVAVVGPATPTANYFETLKCDDSAGAVAVSLPTAVGFAGYMIEVKRSVESGFGITVTPFGAETIDGAATDIINTPMTSRTYRSDGANWMLV